MSASPALLPHERAGLAELYEHPAVTALRGGARAADLPMWVVGGAVRDAVTGRAPSDVDVVVPASAVVRRRLLRSCGGFGRVAGPEATVRGQLFVHGASFPVDVSPLVEVSIEADLRARDLCVNALAFDVHTGQLHDPADGLGDLRRHVLDTPVDPVVTFANDPVRLIRAWRVAASLGAQVAPRVAAAAAAFTTPWPPHLQERRLAELDKFARRDLPGLAHALRESAGGAFAHLVLPHAGASLQRLDEAGVQDVDALMAALVAECDDPVDVLVRFGVPARRARRCVARRAVVPTDLLVPTLHEQD